MEDYVGKFKLVWIGGLAVVLAMVILLVIVLAGFSGGTQGNALLSMGPIAAMLLLVVGELVLFIAMILSLIEIFTSKNDTTFKVLWALVVFILGLIGLILYRMVGRKSLIA